MTRLKRTAFLASVAALALGVTGAGEAATFHGFVGPGATITLKNGSGVKVTRVRAGRHTFLIHDNSSAHNFVLRRGSTRLRATGVSFRGVRSWSVRIVRGGRYVYLCRPHYRTMRGGFRGV
jgi:plastocyanin